MISNYKSQNVRRTASSQAGASITEYALVIVLLAIMCVANVKAIGKNTRSTFCTSIGQQYDQGTRQCEYIDECGGDPEIVSVRMPGGGTMCINKF